MRSLILAVAFGAALQGQVPQGSPEPARPGATYRLRQPSRQPSGQPPWKFFPDLKSLQTAPSVRMPRERISLKFAQPPAQTCAIPLRNVLRRANVDPKMILPPGPEVDARIRIAAPPAPSCDDVK
jgi:hypothetical protein